MTSWFAKPVETRPLSEIISQNTINVRKTRETKIQTFSERVYQKIVEKMTAHSLRSSINEFEVNINDMFSDTGDKLFAEFSSGDKSTEQINEEEYTKISENILQKLINEKFVSRIYTETESEITKHFISISWNA